MKAITGTWVSSTLLDILSLTHTESMTNKLFMTNVYTLYIRNDGVSEARASGTQADIFWFDDSCSSQVVSSICEIEL